MTGITDTNSTGTTLVSYGYTYDAAGLVSQESADLGLRAQTPTRSITPTRTTTS